MDSSHEGVPSAPFDFKNFDKKFFSYFMEDNAFLYEANELGYTERDVIRHLVILSNNYRKELERVLTYAPSSRYIVITESEKARLLGTNTPVEDTP